jgi:hypothetical protein
VTAALVLTRLEAVVLPGRWREGMPASTSPALRARLRYVREELARRTGARAVLHDGWLEVRENDETREDVIDTALDEGLTAIDTAGPELVTTFPLTEVPDVTLTQATSVFATRLARARRHERSSPRTRQVRRGAYLVIESGPSLAFYVQALFDGDELRFEAAAGRHLHGQEPRASLDRLQLLGFLRDPEGSPNRIRSLGRGESPSLFSHLATRALLDVYGVRAGESARLRLAEIEREP